MLVILWPLSYLQEQILFGSFMLLAPLGLIPQGSGLGVVLSADFCSAGGMYTNGAACKVLLKTVALLFYSREPCIGGFLCPF